MANALELAWSSHEYIKRLSWLLTPWKPYILHHSKTHNANSRAVSEAQRKKSECCSGLDSRPAGRTCARMGRGSTASETPTQTLLGLSPTPGEKPKAFPHLLLYASPLAPPHNSPREVAPSIVPTKYPLAWAAIRDAPLREPLVSGLLPRVSSSTLLLPTPITILPIKTSQNLPIRWK